MGNVSDKDSSSTTSSEDSNCDTIAHDISYRNFRAERRRGAGASFNKRKLSFKASKRSSSKSKLKLTDKQTHGATLLISDMEVQVEDGKVAKLVPRSSVLKRKGIPFVQIKAANIRRKSSKKTSRSKPKDSVKITQQLRLSAVMQLAKRTSYDAAVSATATATDTPNIPTVTVRNKTASANQNQRWSHVEVTPKKPVNAHQRAKSSYVNINNNVAKPMSSIGSDSGSNHRSRISRPDLFRDLSADIGRLKLASPVTEV